MIQVTVQQGETLDQALRRFSQKIQHSGILREVKEHSYYEKPSEKRRKQRRRRRN